MLQQFIDIVPVGPGFLIGERQPREFCHMPHLFFRDPFPVSLTGPVLLLA